MRYAAGLRGPVRCLNGKRQVLSSRRLHFEAGEPCARVTVSPSAVEATIRRLLAERSYTFSYARSGACGKNRLVILPVIPLEAPDRTHATLRADAIDEAAARGGSDALATVEAGLIDPSAAVREATIEALSDQGDQRAARRRS